MVKHIFDAPNLVFVFEVINRDELCKSLSSVYGEINTDVYLRRFFDFEWPPRPMVDNAKLYPVHLFDKFQIAEKYFGTLSEADGTPNFIVAT